MSVPGDRWIDTKGSTLRTVGMLFGMITLSNLVSIGFGHRRAATNGYVLFAGCKWTRFEIVFDNLPQSMRVLGGIAVWFCLILTVVAVAATGSVVSKLRA